MSISPEIIEKIRQSIDIVDIINEYVPLKRAGSYYKALSPFQKEKTPSFFISPSRQSFKCYSSGHGGDVFKFIMLYENIDFPTAIRRLAEKSGIEIPEEKGQVNHSHTSKETLIKLHSEIACYWRDLLLKDPRAEHARQYLISRKISEEWIRNYCLGFAPAEWDDSILWAKKSGFRLSDLKEAGLVLDSENGRTYSRFRDRLMFPIYNEMGQPVAFSGRILNQDKNSPKYMNSPETMIFKKSRILFGFDRAKRAILEDGYAMICEGQIDVLRCHSAGIQNVVAPLGTAFTDEHCKLLRRFTDRMVLCLDADRAGQDTAERLGQIILDSDKTSDVLVQSDLGIKVIQLPEGHDPDSLILQKGPEFFKKMLEHPIEYLVFYIQHLQKKHGNETPVAKRRVMEGIAQLLSKVRNGIVLEHHATQASASLDVPLQILKDEIQKLTKNKKTSETDSSQTTTPQAKQIEIHSKLEELLRLFLIAPELIGEVRRMIHPAWIEHLKGADFLLKIMESHTHDEWSTFQNLIAISSPEEQNYLAGLDLDSITLTNSSEGHNKTLYQWIKDMELDYLNQQLVTVSRKLKSLEINEQQRQELLSQISKLTRKKSDLTKSVFQPT
jgi:DNA primase